MKVSWKKINRNVWLRICTVWKKLRLRLGVCQYKFMHAPQRWNYNLSIELFRKRVQKCLNVERLLDVTIGTLQREIELLKFCNHFFDLISWKFMINADFNASYRVFDVQILNHQEAANWPDLGANCAIDSRGLFAGFSMKLIKLFQYLRSKVFYDISMIVGFEWGSWSS